MSVVDTVKTEVATAVKNNNKQVRERLVTQLAANEQDRRFAVVNTAYDQLTSLQTEIDKAKPDAVTIGENGERVTRYTEAAWKKKQEAEAKFAEVDSLLEAAIADDAIPEMWDKLAKKVGYKS